MKKITALLLIVVLLTGCGGDSKTTDCATRVKTECATITDSAKTCADMVKMTCGGGK